MVLVAQVTAPVREMDVPTADEKRTMTGGQ
ncbi:MAG: hypothetical protein QOF73_3499, partial [Thermomicrobiales bacterium]|nr:hypothetical protein [Thermomicrobiales bacterium]